MATLFVLQGRDKGKRFELADLPLTLGRDASNRIQLDDSEISRRHVELRQADGQFVIVDLHSSNGTFVNSEKIDTKALANGDRVQVGKTLLIFTEAEDRSSQHLVHDVDIIGIGKGLANESRILRSVPQSEGSQIFGPPEPDESPWLARARSNLQVMYRTALAVSHTLDIDQLLSRIIDLIFEWVEADRGCVMLVDQETNELTPAVSRNRKGVQADEKMRISRTILDYVMAHREGVMTSDARDDERWEQAQSIITQGVREAICVPMQGRYGIVGVIYIDTYTPPGRVLQKRHSANFTEEHLRLMVAIGHQAALAVEDTSYYSAMLQAERLAAMGQTIATLSHHIKNILQGIRGGSYLIEEGLKLTDNEVIRKGWRIVEKNQDRISSLVLDMLTFSKDREPDLQPADLNETIADVVELQQSRAEEATVNLSFQPAVQLSTCLFDADLMHRAVMNIVGNAIDACEKRSDGRVEVCVEIAAPEKLVRVVVKDNGEGIMPEDLQKIFSVFESRKGARGTGLGLPVSQKILREHGGEILVESVRDVGSRFILQFPLRTPDTGTHAPTMTISPGESGGSSIS